VQAAHLSAAGGAFDQRGLADQAVRLRVRAAWGEKAQPSAGVGEARAGRPGIDFRLASAAQLSNSRAARTTGFRPQAAAPRGTGWRGAAKQIGHRAAVIHHAAGRRSTATRVATACAHGTEVVGHVEDGLVS